jgi:PKD repeat protein
MVDGEECNMKYTWIVGILLVLLLVGTVGATVVTINASHNGRVGMNANGGWNAMRNGVGDYNADNTTTPYVYFISTDTTNQYDADIRYMVSFDTSSLPDDATITGAFYNITGKSKSGNWASMPALSLVDALPANTSDYANGDYDATTFTRQATDIPYASFLISNNTNQWTLTNTTWINKTGSTSYMVTTSWDTDNSSPTWAATKNVLFDISPITTYSDQLIITYTSGDSAPTAAFSGTPTSGSSPLSVTFTDASTNTPTARAWYFWSNETVSNTSQNPIQAFSSGTYSIRLNASNTKGYDWENKTAYIGVGGGYSGVFPDVYDAIPYRVSASRWTGLRNGIGTGVVTTSTQMYQSLDTSSVTNNFADEYRPGFTVNTSTIGSSSTITGATITAYAAGYTAQIDNENLTWIDFTPANKSAYVSADYNATTFTQLADNVSITTFSPEGTQLTWTLNAAGLAAIQKTGLTSFMLANNHTVNNQSPTWKNVSSNEASIHGLRHSNGTAKPYLSVNYSSIGGGAPSADFTTNVTSCLSPCTVQFTDTSTNEPTVWAWAYSLTGEVGPYTLFNNTTQQNPIEVFYTTGVYTIELMAQNPTGTGYEFKSDYLLVGESWTSFTSSATVGKPPLTVSFTDTSTSSPTNWDWYWSNDETKDSDLQDPSAVFSDVGIYPVRLYASGGSVNGWSNSTTVYVGYAPTAHFSWVVV